MIDHRHKLSGKNFSGKKLLSSVSNEILSHGRINDELLNESGYKIAIDISLFLTVILF